MDLVVKASVFAIHVHIDRRVDHRVVERGVEHFLLSLRSLDLDLGKLFLPSVRGRRGDLLERFSRSLGRKVLQRALRSCGGQSNLHGQLRVLRSRELEPGHQFASCHRREVVVLVEFAPASLIVDLLAVRVTIFRNRLREGDREVGVVGAGPSVCDAVAGQKGVVLHLNFRPKGLSVVVVYSVDKIQNHLAISAFRV